MSENENDDETEELFGSEGMDLPAATTQDIPVSDEVDLSETSLRCTPRHREVIQKRRLGGSEPNNEGAWHDSDGSTVRRRLRGGIDRRDSNQARRDSPRLVSTPEIGVDSPATIRRTARQTDSKIENIEKVLADRTQEWTQRVKSLHELQSILSPSYHLQSELFESKSAIFIKLVPGLCVQLGDKRSQLVKEVCKTISSCAESLGPGFHRAAQQLSQSLLPLTYVTVKVISSSASACLKSLVALLPLPLFLPELESALRDDHVQLRAACARFLLQVLRERASAELAEHEAQLSSILITCLNDPSVSVRTAAKEAFKDYALCFPTQARNTVPWKVNAGMKTQLTQALREVGVHGYATAAGGGQSPAMKSADFRAFRHKQAQDASAHSTPQRGGDPMQHGGGDGGERPPMKGRLLSGPPMRIRVDNNEEGTPFYGDTPAHKFFTTPARPRSAEAATAAGGDAGAGEESSEELEDVSQTPAHASATSGIPNSALLDEGKHSAASFYLPSKGATSSVTATKPGSEAGGSQVLSGASAPAKRIHSDPSRAQTRTQTGRNAEPGMGSGEAGVAAANLTGAVPAVAARPMMPAAATPDVSGTVQAAVQGMGAMEPSSEVVGEIKVVDFTAEAKLSATASPVRKRWEKRPAGRFARGGGPSPDQSEEGGDQRTWTVGTSAQRMVARSHNRVSVLAPKVVDASRAAVPVQHVAWPAAHAHHPGEGGLLLQALLSDCASYLTKQDSGEQPANETGSQEIAESSGVRFPTVSVQCANCDGLRSALSLSQARLGLLWCSFALGNSVSAVSPREARDTPMQDVASFENETSSRDGAMEESTGTVVGANTYEEERRQRILQNVKKMEALGLNPAEPEARPSTESSDGDGSWEQEETSSEEEETAEGELGSEGEREGEEGEMASRGGRRHERRETRDSVGDMQTGGPDGRATGRVDTAQNSEEEDISDEDSDDDDDFHTSQLSDSDGEGPQSRPLASEDSVSEAPRSREDRRRTAKQARFRPPWGRHDHPSQVDPEQPGLSRMQRFRAEVVKAVYESDGTSEAQGLMGSSVPSFMEDAFADAGWEKDWPAGKPAQREGQGRDAAQAGTRFANSALMQDAGEESDEVVISCEGTGSEDMEGAGRQEEGGGSSGGSRSSSSLSSARKRLRDMQCRGDGETEGGGGVQGESDESEGRRKRSKPVVVDRGGQKPGEFCRRPGISGKYYSVQNKYVCNNCGLTGHVKRTCKHPERILDNAMERAGWQVTEVSRKGGAAVEKFFVPPDKSEQLRGIVKLQAYLAAHNASLGDFVPEIQNGQEGGQGRGAEKGGKGTVEPGGKEKENTKGKRARKPKVRRKEGEGEEV